MSQSEEREDKADLCLSPDEAIVLFELLSRWIRDKPSATPGGECFESSAECVVLHGILCDLEKQLVAPFKSDYGRLLGDARKRIAKNYTWSTLRD
jgi:hypothetical protein